MPQNSISSRSRKEKKPDDVRYNEFDERRVVIYARVSTEHEAQISALSNQLEWYQQYLDHHPEWNLIDRYVDEGITGTSAEKRPGFTQMIEDAKAHKFDLIITREVSRFARNTEETLHFTKCFVASVLRCFLSTIISRPSTVTANCA